MGTGGGANRKQLSLEDYQKKNSDVMTVKDNDDGSKTYTFVGDATIPEDTTIIFDKNDQLLTENGTTVNLDGKFDITEETDEIKRITINGTLNQTGSMEFGTITNGGTGVEVNSSNSWNLIAPAEVIVDKLDSSSTGIAVEKNGTVSFQKDVNEDINFNFSNLQNSIGLHIKGGTVKSNGDVNLNINLFFYQSIVIKLTEEGEFNHLSGSMKIGVTGFVVDSRVISIEKGEFIQSGGSMEINHFYSLGSGSVQSEANGINIENNGQFIQSGGSMEIGSVDNRSYGINIENNGQFIQSGGSMKIESVDNDSYGINIENNGQFIQSGGSMEIGSVQENSRGIFIQKGTTQFDVFDLTIDNVSGKGIVSLEKMSNKGKVRVLGDGILYSTDDEKEANPAPQLNTDGGGGNEIFTGTTYYGPVTLEQYQSLVGDTILQKDGTNYIFITNHNIDYGYTITFEQDGTGQDVRLTINEGILVGLEGQFVIPDTTNMTRISNLGTFILNASVGGRAEINFGDIICSGNSFSDAIGIDNMGILFNTSATFNQDGKITFGTINSTVNENFKAYGIKTYENGNYVMKHYESTTTSLTFEKILNSGIGIYVGSSSSFKVEENVTITLEDKTSRGITGTGIELSEGESGSAGIFTNNGVVNFRTTQNEPLTLPYSIAGDLVDPKVTTAFNGGTGTYV